MSRFLVLAFALVGACAVAEEASTESAVTTAVPAERITMLAPLGVGMLDADTPVGAGKLLPDAARGAIGQLVEHETADESVAALRVVCTRLVPGSPAQVRFVLQPVGATGARDAAVHVFYDLPASAQPALAHALAAGAVDPLAIAATGSVSRVTFVRNVDVKGNAWVFGGVDAHDGAFVPLAIPRTGTSEQRVVTNGAFPFAASPSPRPTGDPQLGLLLDPVRLGILFDADAATAKARVLAADEAALALETPARQDTTNTDCVSCHLAGSARKVAAASAAAHGFALASPPVLDAPSPAESLRACGYVGTKPVLSQRLQTETTEAAAAWAVLAR